jgi:general secretion pathway protein G
MNCRLAKGPASGFSLIELVIVAPLLSILAMVALLTGKYVAKRNKEIELRSALRELRFAIDEYKRYSDAGLIPEDLGADGYPAEMEDLYEGIELVGQAGREAKFLRRLPVDPMTGEMEWGLRSYQDDFDSDSWGGENIFDVYSLSQGVGLNGVPYAQW